MANSKTFASVSELVRQTSDDPAFAEAVEKRIASRMIVKKLMVLRATHDISQKDLAAKLGCTQSRVSKLENMTDGDLRIGDLANYAGAMGFGVRIVLEPKENTPVSRVKKLFFQIKHELDKMAELASNDHVIVKGVSGFFGEAAFNLINMLQHAARKLPKRPEDGTPYISIDICMDEMDEEGLDSVTPMGESTDSSECSIRRGSPARKPLVGAGSS